MEAALWQLPEAQVPLGPLELVLPSGKHQEQDLSEMRAQDQAR